MKAEFLPYLNYYKKLYNQMFRKPAGKYELTQIEIDILLFLHNNPSFNTAKDIVALRGLAKSNVSNALDNLRKRGYLASETDPENRKLVRLTLLEEAGEAVRELKDCQKQFQEIIYDGFTGEELTLLRSLQEKCNLNVLRALKNDSDGGDSK